MAELVEAAGAVPVLANRGDHSRELSWEAIGSAEFDILVVSCCGFSVERAMVDIESSEELARLQSTRPGVRLILFDGNHYFSRPGPRLVESAELLHAALAGSDPLLAGASVESPYREILFHPSGFGDDGRG
jgi:iron complex transport system substrate-binding protein